LHSVLADERTVVDVGRNCRPPLHMRLGDMV
jgi:hypothetical protein